MSALLGGTVGTLPPPAGPLKRGRAGTRAGSEVQSDQLASLPEVDMSDPVQSILSRALPPAELVRRVRELLAGPNDAAQLAALLPELLNALGVVVDGDGGPLADELLGLVCRLAPAAP